MTEPDLTPAQSEAVRRLLAGARHDEPMPPEVVDRLDGVLSELRDERRGDTEVNRGGSGVSDGASDGATDGAKVGATDGEGQAAPVTPLRRRSRIPQVLLAAAAVVAVGFGVTQVMPSGDDDKAGAGSQADSSMADAAPEEGGSRLGREAPSESAVQDRTRSGTYLAQAQGRRLVDRIPLAGLQSAAPADGRAEISARKCGPATIGPGQRRATATYEGTPALVVFHRPVDGERQADVYVCDSSRDRELLTSVTVSAR